MTLERAIALVMLVICMLYGYTAWGVMDSQLPPFMARNPVWPSSLPKLLAISGGFFSLIVLVAPPSKVDDPDINLSRLGDYNFGQALALLGLMSAYALLLMPIGFLAATFLFLLLGFYLLGERRWLPMILAATIASLSIWYLVQQILGIFLRPLPAFMGI